jgi:hypothetical protein
MHDIYRRIEDQIKQKPENLQALAERSLTWVFYAERRLEEDEFIAAASYKPGSNIHDKSRDYSIDDILDSCANLLYVENGYVRPIHYSVNDYILPYSRGRSESAFNIVTSSDRAHYILAETCLSYLTCTEMQKGPCRRREDLYFGRVMALPLCHYAAQNFDEHSTKVDISVKEIGNSLFAFLSSPTEILASTM